MRYIFLIALTFFNLIANAQIAYQVGKFTLRLNENGYSINGGPSIRWKEYNNLNLIMGGTKSTRESRLIYDNYGNICVAVKYMFSQFQMFGIARTNEQTLVNFCPTYISKSKKFGFAPLVVPLVQDRDVSFTLIQQAYPFDFLSSLGFSYSCVSSDGDKEPCKLLGPGIDQSSSSNGWIVE